jgi:DNA-binding CsgD family transcriptional regulator/tetratricopeptide (TPR) repeat protein
MSLEPVGRASEIAEISAFLTAARGSPAAVAITGDPGIGKTILWEHLLRVAGASSRVLSCHPALAERPLAFSALEDLFDSIGGRFLAGLPVPRRVAVEAALLRRPAADFPVAAGRRIQPEQQVLARGILDILRALSADRPLVIAIDDTHWLDAPSARVLEFCFRRLQPEPVSIVLTFRTRDSLPFGLDRILPADRLCRVRLKPPSLGAVGEILRAHLGAVLPRYILTRLYEACGGNPLYALECARTILDQPRLPAANEPIPVPRSLSEAIQRHIGLLAPEVRQVGRLMAASPLPREGQIRAAVGDREAWTAIDQAVDAGLIRRDGEILRFTHPLLRSVIYSTMTLDERRQVHRSLGAAAGDIEERAWHHALGADRTSREISAMLDAAARNAASRGAPGEAATLTEQAVRLTPGDQPSEASRRTVRAADYYFRAGDIARSQELIQGAIAGGAPSAPLLIRLATIYYRQSGWPLAEQTFGRAAEEARADPGLRAHAEQEIAFARMVAGDLPAAAGWARASLRSAERAADPRLIAHSLARIALFEFLQGNGVRADLLDKARALEATAAGEGIGRLPMLDASLVTGMVLKWCDQLDEARPHLTECYRRALDLGDEASLPFLLYHFSQLESWAGNWDTAEHYALEGCRVADESRQEPLKPATLYSLALVRANQGRVADARELAAQALYLSQQTGNVPLASMAVSVLGFLALSLDDYEEANARLGPLAEAGAAAGLREPGVVRFLPDEIEALAALHQMERAWGLTRRLETQGKALGRAWALAAGARCHAHLAALEGNFDEALTACGEALHHHEQLAMPAELGRTLLVKGMVERRARRNAAARESLLDSLAIFERLGAPLWVDKAHRELPKTTAHETRKSLTETERRIADLVIQGRRNREIAGSMFISENTVQTHLRHIFQKLEVRSRTQLAAKLLSGPDPR